MPLVKCRFRRGSKEVWERNNPVLDPGEIGLEVEKVNEDGTLEFPHDVEGDQLCPWKIGDGKTRWNDLPYFRGLPGREGPQGKEGPPGKDGAPGRDGAPGKDGADGNEGPQGKEGPPGKDGADGAPGKDGADGNEGPQGKEGPPGKDGAPGRDGKDGAPGKDGPPGVGATLSDAVNSQSSITAASSKAVAEAYTKATEAYTLASNIKVPPAFKVGDWKFSIFAPDELEEQEPGWYFMGGQGYAVASDQAAALWTLPTALRTRWGIHSTNGYVHMPNMFYTDGRGYVVRAVDGTKRIIGSVELDAFQGHSHTGLYALGVSGSAGRFASGSAMSFTNIAFNAGVNSAGYGWPRNADETRALNIGMTPVMYLGV